MSITANLLYQHGVNEENERSHYHGRICVNPADDEIMIVPERDGYCYFSDDAGATFNISGQIAPASGASDYAVRCMRYHPEEDTWWARWEGEPSGGAAYRYSTDDGATWTEITESSAVLTQYRVYSFNLTADGTMYLQGSNASTGNWAVARDTSIKAGMDPTAGNRHTYTTLNGAVTCMGSGILDSQYFVSAQNYSPPRLTIAKMDMSAHTMWGASGTANSTQIGAANNIGIDQSGVLDYCLALMSETAGLVTLDKLSYNAPHPIPQITYDFGVDVEYSAIHHGNNSFALIAKDVSSGTTMYVAFMDPVTEEWDGPYTIILPIAHSTSADNSTSRTQLEYFKDGKWLYSYITGTGGTNFRFTLVDFTIPSGLPVYLQEAQVSAAYLGDTVATALYKGDTQLYP